MPAHHWTTLDERAFLTSKIPDFRTAQEGGTLTRFWVELEGAWFLRYPMEAKVGVRAHDVPGPPLTDEENKRLGAATAVQKAQLKAWMGYHSRKLLRAAGASASGSKKKGGLFKLLKKGPSKTRPLHSVEIYHKLYVKKIKGELMRRGYGALNEEAVEAARAAAAPGVPIVLSTEEAASKAEEEEEETLARIKEHRKLRMALVRNTVEAMYAAEAEDVKIEIEAETEARRNDRDEVEAIDGKRTPEQLQEAIDQVGEVLKRVTDAIEEETGWHGFFMLGGPMPRREGEISSKTFCFGGTPEGCDFIATYPNFADVRTGFNQYLKRAFPHNVRDKRALDPKAAAPSLDDLIPLDPDDEQEAPAAKAAKPVRRKKPAATKKKAPELPAPELPVSTAAIPLTTSPLVSTDPISPTQDFPVPAGFDERLHEIVADFGDASGGSGLPLDNGWSSEDEALTLSFGGDGSVDFGRGPDDDVLESWRSIGFDSAGEDIPPEPSRPNGPRPMYRGGAAVNREIGASPGRPRATPNVFSFGVSPTFHPVPAAAQTEYAIPDPTVPLRQQAVSATALPLPEQPTFPSLPPFPLHAASTSTPTPSPQQAASAARINSPLPEQAAPTSAASFLAHLPPSAAHTTTAPRRQDHVPFPKPGILFEALATRRALIPHAPAPAVQTPPLTSGAPSGTPRTSSSSPWIPPPSTARTSATSAGPVSALARFTSALSTATATSTTTAMPVGVTPPSFSFSASVSHAPVAPLMESRPMGNPPPAAKLAAAKKRRGPAKSKGPAATPASAAAAPAPEGDENGTGDEPPAAPAKRGRGRPRKDDAAPQPVMTEAARAESARIHNEEQELHALRAEMLRREKAIADRARGARTTGAGEIFVVARPVRAARAALHPDGTAVIQIPRGSRGELRGGPELGGATDLDAAQAAADAALEQRLRGGPRTAPTVDPAAPKTRAAKAKAEGKGKGKGKGKKRKADDAPAAAKAPASK
ncbi:hypothetical protein B0H14DRAFT_3488963 [Mycena olivaceomarginata]|nr:hypothetical protein B0H14DRAFT_3488963 [Mycena olivaceomarginata]